MLYIIIAVLVVLLALAVGIQFAFRAAAERRIVLFESRVARAERTAAGELFERLRVLRMRVGVLYLDGLPCTSSQQLHEAFAEGVKHAARNQWDRAIESWQAGLEHARNGEQGALRFLVGACHYAAERHDEARAAFGTALAESRAMHDRYGVAATVNALAMLDRTERRLPEARVGFIRAAQFWSGMGELREQARALSRAAGIHEEQGELVQALRQRRVALQVCERSRDAVGAIHEYTAIARLLARQGELDAARAACEDGLLMARKSGDRSGEVELLTMVGNLHLRQRSYQRAVEVLERALRHLGSGRNRIAEAELLVALAQASEGLGRAEVASEYYERALEHARSEKQARLQAVCQAGLAVSTQRHGALEQARLLLDEAVECGRSAGDVLLLGQHLVARAVLAVEMHDPAGAGRDLDEALQKAASAGDSGLRMRATMVQARMLAEDGRLADAEAKLASLSGRLEPDADMELIADYRFECGHIARALRRSGQALEEWQAAVEGYGKAGLPDAQARARMFLAEALVEAGEVEAGAAAAAEALRLISRSGTRKDEIRALRAVAFADARRGRTRDAHVTLDRAVALARETRDQWSEAAALLALGRLAREVEVFDAARDNLIAARRLFGELGAATRVIEIDREVEQLPSPDMGVQFLDRGQSSHHQLSG